MGAGVTVIYARISLDRHDGAGVERQLEGCRKLARDRGWDVAQEFIDNSISASRFSRKARPEYGRMLEEIEAGRVGRVIAWHEDRLYRQPRELEDIFRILDQHGAGWLDVVTHEAGIVDFDSPDGIWKARMGVAMAAHESDHKSRRVAAQRAQDRERGRPQGAPRAFGWRNRMTPDPEESQMILEAVDHVLAGGSLLDVARRWERAGARRPQSGKTDWNVTAVRVVLTNPRNAGLMSHRPRPTRTGPWDMKPVVLAGVVASWPALIDRDRWDRVQAILAARGAQQRGIPKGHALLSGLLRCGTCGATMIRTRSGPRSAWRCPPYSVDGRPKPCGRVQIDGAAVEATLVEAALRRLDDAKLSVQSDNPGDEAVMMELQAIEAEWREAQALVAGGVMGAAAFARFIAPLEERRERAMKLLRPRRPRLPFEEAGQVRSLWPTMTIDQRRAVLEALIEVVGVRPYDPKAPHSRVHGGRDFDVNRLRVAWR